MTRIGYRWHSTVRVLAACILSACLIPAGLGATVLFDEGEKLILDNKLREAGVMLEQALREDPRNERIYLYLGVIYEKLGDTSRAVAVMTSGLEVAAGAKPMLYFNLGNNLVAQGELGRAEDMYSRALALDAAMGDAYLNRANTRLRAKLYPEAINDYVVYLRLEPQSSQREEIERVLAALRGMLADEERSRQDAAARQKALMDDVLSALKNASSDARNIGAGSEQIQVEFESSDIED